MKSAVFTNGWLYVTTIYTLTSIIPVSDSILLDESGNYQLVVAIDETTVQNSISSYIKTIEDSFKDLSDRLHSNTDGRFSISKVDLLIPSHWNVNVDEPASYQFYEGADIKISHRHYLPLTENPNPCGRPGQYIQLPYNFFDSFDNGTYGPVGKALLSLFVRLRFGAWEEHGYPGDPMFPYYWKPLQGSSWEVNSCTDKPITGEYRNVEDGSDCQPALDSGDPLYPPSTNCRFIPDNSQEATSSLMSFHYLESFNKLCDVDTHNREAPTPQNFYCKNRSVKEVIERTPDWKKVTNPSKPVAPVVQFKVVKQQESRPILYILLDGGISQAPGTVIKKIADNLKTLISSKELADVRVGVGRFPSDIEKQAFSRIVPLSTLRNSTHVDFIGQAFYEQLNIKAGIRNYAKSIREITLELKRMKNKAGAVILVVKTGPESNKASFVPEYEVLLPLHDANIRVWALEIEGNVIQPGLALKQIVQKSFGEHLTLASSIANVDQALSDYFTKLRDLLKSNSIPLQRNVKLIFRDIVPADSRVVAPMRGILTAEAYAFPVIGDIVGGSVKLEEPVFDVINEWLNPIDFTGTEITNWDDTTKRPRNGLYKEMTDLDIYAVNALIWNKFQYVCTGEADSCKVMLVIFANVQDPSIFEDGYVVSVSTSAVNAEVDLAVETSLSDVGSPFVIHAKIEHNGIPIRAAPGLSVTATFYNEDRSFAGTVELKDGGPSSPPDMKMSDGVFSGTVVPMSDGNYLVFVTLKYAVPQMRYKSTRADDPLLYRTLSSGDYHVSDKAKENVLQSSPGRLFPVDQTGYMGCGSGYFGCWSKVPDTEFLASVDLIELISFKNSVSYETRPYRIMDVRLTPLSNYEVAMEWTVPSGPSRLESGEVDRIDGYNFRHSNNLDSLLNDFDGCESLTIDSPKLPGESESRTWSYGREDKRFVGIKAFRMINGRTLESDISVTASIDISIDPSPITTIATPTATPPTSTSTTTSTEATTTTGTGPSNPTTFRTTSFRTTTGRSTSVRTTTAEVTTLPPPTVTTEKIVHWYKQTEGIITLAVFGGALALITLAGVTFMWCNRYR